MLDTGNISVQEGDISTIVVNISNDAVNQVQAVNVDKFSEDAKKLLGQHIPKNTVRAPQLAINKLAIFGFKVDQIFKRGNLDFEEAS